MVRNEEERTMVDHIEIADSSAPPSPSARRVAASDYPPLIPGEDRAAYDTLLTRVCAVVKPVNILEEMWVSDTSAWNGISCAIGG
jgi:hypothetical protein